MFVLCVWFVFVVGVGVVVGVFLIFSLRGRMLYWFSALLLSKRGEVHYDELSYRI